VHHVGWHAGWVLPGPHQLLVAVPLPPPWLPRPHMCPPPPPRATHTALLHRDDDSHMACRPIRRKPPGQLVADCGPEGEGGNSSSEAAAESLSDQTWSMDPAYYQFRNCRCLDVSWGDGSEWGRMQCRGGEAQELSNASSSSWPMY
jgi:hypothetical protein